MIKNVLRLCPRSPCPSSRWPLPSNRSKGDKDPANWMPVAVDRRTYTVDWVADKLRWRLSADAAELQALDRYAEQCPPATVTYQQAP
ncbi:hypothetical protein AB0E08_38835 [Streptomyces sp. NPDC048281]|uniref:hypothetical protein n=1 Tax=Streptomyces sp. NPDC048281 TaxID=3154715 RepID=UPI0034429AB7